MSYGCFSKLSSPWPHRPRTPKHDKTDSLSTSGLIHFIQQSGQSSIFMHSGTLY